MLLIPHSKHIHARALELMAATASRMLLFILRLLTTVVIKMMMMRRLAIMVAIMTVMRMHA